MVVGNHREARPALLQKVFRSSREYPTVDAIIIAYAATVLVFQVLMQISPFMTLLAKTPLYSIQTYLGLLGGGLILLDVFTTKKIWQGKYSLFLYAILVLAALSSLRTVSYGIKENLFKLCWAAIQFVLIYSCVYRASRDKLIKYIRRLFFALLAIWAIACCVSFYQYANQIGYRYVVNPLAKDSSSNRQGFYDNRLFGIFYTLNHAAYISLFFLIVALVFAWQEKRRRIRIALLFSDFVLLCYIILSGSRSAMISLMAASAVLTFFRLRNALIEQGQKKPLLPLAAAVLAVALCFGGFWCLKQGLELVPAWTAAIRAEMEPDFVPDDFFPEDDILERDGLEEDASNGRLSIWRDYISLYKDVGAIGLSPGNYMLYVRENHPELYIVEYIRTHYSDKYESGIIYHVHSGYMMVYVSAGILGLLSLLAYMLLCVRRVFCLVKNRVSVSPAYIGAVALVVMGAISAVLDEGLFFQNTPHTTIFWFALGIIMADSFVSSESLKKL